MSTRPKAPMSQSTGFQRGLTITATYPCCGEPCKMKKVWEHGRTLMDEVVERRHVCKPTSRVAKHWRIAWRVISHGNGQTAYRVEFTDIRGQS